MNALSFESIRVTRTGTIAVVRYHHPPRNFMTARFLHEMRLCMQTLERDTSVRVVVFTGERDGHYILHTEMNEIVAMLKLATRIPAALDGVALALARGAIWMLSRWPSLANLLLAPRGKGDLVRNAVVNVMLLCDAVRRSSKITIAAINGSSVGGGFELSMCFDYRFMMNDPSFVVGLPEVLIGMVPGFGGTQWMARLAGSARALETLLAGEFLGAECAETLGIVTRAIAVASFHDEVMAFAERVSRRPPLAVAEIKRAVLGGFESQSRRGRFVELAAVMRVARTRDTDVGVRDYVRETERQLALPEQEQPSLRTFAGVMDRAELTAFLGK